MKAPRRGVVWLDRDGTIVDDPGYLADPGAVVLLAGAAEAVAALRRGGATVVLVTNQSGIARGLVSRATVDAIHLELRRQLRAHGGDLDGIYVCPHLPRELLPSGTEACPCRKPATGLVDQARSELGLGGLPAVVVGDKLSDVQLARAIGAAAVLVCTGAGRDTLEQLDAPSPADGGADTQADAPADVHASLPGDTLAHARTARPDHVAADLAAAVPWILDRLGLASPQGSW